MRRLIHILKRTRLNDWLMISLLWGKPASTRAVIRGRRSGEWKNGHKVTKAQILRGPNQNEFVWRVHRCAVTLRGGSFGTVHTKKKKMSLFFCEFLKCSFSCNECVEVVKKKTSKYHNNCSQSESEVKNYSEYWTHRTAAHILFFTLFKLCIFFI